MENQELEVLIRKLNDLARAVTFGNYEKTQADGLFELTEKGKYPPIFSELAESFGLMLVKIEAKEYLLEEISLDLDRAKTALNDHMELMEQKVMERVSEISSRKLWLEQEIQQRKRLERGLQEANQKLLDLVNRDELTQLSNRRCFNARIQEEFTQLERIRAPMSLILCDVDQFKLYNDTYGHPRGDECLRKVARAIRRNVKRASDLVARYGGEEFAVILPHTEPINAFRVAETIRAGVEALALPHKHSKVAPHVTISLGVSGMVPTRLISPATLIRTADEALYEAKGSGGRNCSVLWREQEQAVEEAQFAVKAERQS